MSEQGDELTGGGGDLGEDVEGEQSGSGGGEDGGGGTFADESYEAPEDPES